MNDIATRGVKGISETLKLPAVQSKISSALMGAMKSEEFIAHCLFALKNRPDLLRASHEEQMNSIYRCAQLGLPPGPFNMVSLIPRKNGRGGVSIDVSPQWQGLKVIMERSPNVASVDPYLVHRIDEFAYDYGQIVHRFDPLHPDRIFRHPEDLRGDDPDLRGGYLLIQMRDGSRKFHLVTGHKIERQRKCAQTQSVWRKWYEEMCLKSVVRDAWNRQAIPLDFSSPAQTAPFMAVEEIEAEHSVRVVDRSPRQIETVDEDQVGTEVLEGELVEEPGALDSLGLSEDELEASEPKPEPNPKATRAKRKSKAKKAAPLPEVTEANRADVAEEIFAAIEAQVIPFGKVESLCKLERLDARNWMELSTEKLAKLLQLVREGV